jgi:hypothetical protein
MSDNPTDTDTQWVHIKALVKSGGHITLGRMAPLDGVAVAGDEHNLYAALRRRPDETIPALLQRLNQAIGLAQSGGTRTNEINDSRYVLKPPSTRKRR